MESDEIEAESLGDVGDFLDTLPVGVPMLIRQDAAGFLDRLERGVVLTDRAEHAGDDLDAGGGEKFRRFFPSIRVVTERVEGQLQAGKPDFAEISDQGLGGLGLQRPTAYSQAGFDLLCHLRERRLRAPSVQIPPGVTSSDLAKRLAKLIALFSFAGGR